MQSHPGVKLEISNGIPPANLSVNLLRYARPEPVQIFDLPKIFKGVLQIRNQKFYEEQRKSLCDSRNLRLDKKRYSEQSEHSNKANRILRVWIFIFRDVAGKNIKAFIW